jgi:HK97 family phage major capsid protein
MRERLAALNKEAKNILAEGGTDNWTKESQGKFDAKMEEAERVQAKIEATQRLLDKDAEDNFSDVIYKDEDRDAAKDAKSKAVLEGFELYLRKGFGTNPQVGTLTAEQLQKVKNTLSTTTGSQGGFAVQSAVAKMLIDFLKNYAWMRKVADQITTEQGNPLSYPTSDGTAEVGEWIAQNTTATAADPVFGSAAVNVFKASSKIVAAPIELLQDSQIDITAMITKRLAQRIGRISNVGYTTGGGSVDPFGMVTQASVGKVGLVGQTLLIIYDDLVDMVDSIDAAYLDVPATDIQMPGVDPGWMISQTMRKVVRKIKDTAGRPIWTPSYDGGIFSAKTPDTLLGYPVYINNDLAVPAANAKTLAFGNFKKYLIRDAMDVTMFRFDDSAYMKLGQVGFLAWARTGGNLLDTAAVKLYQHSAT